MTLVRIAGSRSFAGSKLVEMISLSRSLRQLSLVMDQALEEAGIDRKEVYVTNTVKHFKWEPRGKRRIHQKPNSREIAACRPWAGSGATPR
jgi:Uracil DNA glycosylase superfamily